VETSSSRSGRASVRRCGNGTRLRWRSRYLAEGTTREHLSANWNERARHELSPLDSQPRIVAKEQSKRGTVALLLARRRVNGTTPVMHFQMTKRAYEQMLALVAGSDLRVERKGKQSRNSHGFSEPPKRDC
jgi:hypothetical protein